MIPLVVLIVVIAVIVFYFVGIYNKLVELTNAEIEAEIARIKSELAAPAP